MEKTTIKGVVYYYYLEELHDYAQKCMNAVELFKDGISNQGSESHDRF